MTVSVRVCDRPPRAFTLVEVTLALGIVAFALVALTGLLAGGMQTSRESAEEVNAAHLASSIIGQRRAAPVAVNAAMILPPLNDPTRFPILATGSTNAYRGQEFLTRDGRLAATPEERFYRLDYRTARNASGRLASIQLSVVTPWQAVPAELGGGPAPSAQVELVTFLATTPPGRP